MNRLKLHLDTDIGGDIDDLCALGLLLARPALMASDSTLTPLKQLSLTCHSHSLRTVDILERSRAGAGAQDRYVDASSCTINCHLEPISCEEAPVWNCDRSASRRGADPALATPPRERPDRHRTPAGRPPAGQPPRH